MRDTKDELRLANTMLTEHIVNLQEIIGTLESHNRDLLAANQVMREALEGMCAIYDTDGDHSPSDGFVQREKSRKALAINPSDVTLIEVGETDVYETPIAPIIRGRITKGFASGLKLYTIQTKSNTE
jgi:hypothetical protein